MASENGVMVLSPLRPTLHLDRCSLNPVCHFIGVYATWGNKTTFTPGRTINTCSGQWPWSAFSTGYKRWFSELMSLLPDREPQCKLIRASLIMSPRRGWCTGRPGKPPPLWAKIPTWGGGCFVTQTHHPQTKVSLFVVIPVLANG